jgi:hypothetical protein
LFWPYDWLAESVTNALLSLAPSLAEVPTTVRLCICLIGYPIGTLGICQFEGLSRESSLFFSAFEVEALTLLPIDCLSSLTSIPYK